ncbi:3-oxoacid CoA-transferase subunit B [Oceanobacillus damuensis]|uniref:3-oxoacid CoA-transferase subunit B n=1 Tax=Oceanobacillus damuensis TaxID=937928 RepID=UPI0008337CDF|nr:3-oxoacid CoA-transferase subunit B [Oceanobacillus damuensis]
MNVKLSRNELIAKRVAEELEGRLIVNLGIGIPTLVPQYLDNPEVFLHTENGMLGIDDVEEDNIDPNIVNAGKLPIAETKNSSYFNSAESFAMIRGGHVDVAVLGALQVDETGKIANWAIPGKNIIGVGGAMDLLVGAKKIVVAMTHLTKKNQIKIKKQCEFPLTSTRPVDMIVTDYAVFRVKNEELYLTELMPGVTLEEVKENTEANFTVQLKGEEVY